MKPSACRNDDNDDPAGMKPSAGHSDDNHDPAGMKPSIGHSDGNDDPALVASDLRAVLGVLMRRLRVEHRFPLSQGAVLGRLDREGPRSISELAQLESMRPQSMAQTVGELEEAGLVKRRPDPHDRRRALMELTEEGALALADDRRRREGWLARAIAAELSAEEQRVLRDAAPLLRRLSESS